MMASFVNRPNEYDRLVAFLTDQRFFLPVAVTTSLPGGYGFGKTALVRAVCQDARVRAAFVDGIVWVTLGSGLTNLQIFDRIERLVFELTGKHSAFDTLEEAEARLHEVLHPRRTLLVLDEVSDETSLSPFLKSGPGGACLLITHDDGSLPITARRVPVDIMMPGEAEALLLHGLLPEEPEQPAAQEPAPQAGPPQEEELQPEPGLAEMQLGMPLAELAEMLANEPETDDSLLAAPEVRAAIERLTSSTAPTGLPALRMPAEVREKAAVLADRLNDWPMLLALVNGLLRGRFSGGVPGAEQLAAALDQTLASLQRLGLASGWRVDDPIGRQRAVDAVLAACLEPFSAEDRERCLELAVFDPEEAVSCEAVAVLWNLASDATCRLLERLASRALIEMDARSGAIYLPRGMHTALREQLWAGQLAELNRRLVENYHARCQGGWAAGPDDGYYFQHLAGHLEMAGRMHDLQSLLFDYDWVAQFLNSRQIQGGKAGDFYSLLMDYERALSSALDQQSAQLRLVQDALRLSARVLARDPAQLAPQLLGRLLPFNEPEIRGMIEKARDGQGRTWLRPLAGCFTPPGGDELRVIHGHEDWVTAVALLPDGQRAVSGSLDGTLRIWDLANGQALQVIAAHEGGVSALQLAPGGLQAVSAGWDGMVRVWDLAAGKEERVIAAHHEPVGALVLTPDGKHAITGADDRLIRVWNLETGAMEMELLGHSDLVRVLAITPDGRTLISGSWDYTLRLWDLENGKLMHILTGHDGWVRSLTVSPDGYYAISGAWDRTVRVWDLWTGETVRMAADFSAPVYSLAVSSDSRMLLTGGGDGSVRLWDFETMAERRALTGHGGGVNDMALTPGGRFMVSASADRTVRVWDLDAVKSAAMRVGHDGPVYALTPLPDGLHALTGSWDGTLKVWEPSAGKEIRTLSGHEGGVISLAVTADGGVAVSGSRDCTVRLWDLSAGSEMCLLKGHEHPVTSVAVTPDGRLVASGDAGGVVRAWDAQTGACLAEFRGESAIWACALSADGRVIAASETGGKMYFLEIER